MKFFVTIAAALLLLAAIVLVALPVLGNDFNASLMSRRELKSTLKLLCKFDAVGFNGLVFNQGVRIVTPKMRLAHSSVVILRASSVYIPAPLHYRIDCDVIHYFIGISNGKVKWIVSREQKVSSINIRKYQVSLERDYNVR